MTNYEKIISEMTVEKMAEVNVKYYPPEGMYFTSDGEDFDYRCDAIAHEIEWLNKEVTE